MLISTANILITVHELWMCRGGSRHTNSRDNGQHWLQQLFVIVLPCFGAIYFKLQFNSAEQQVTETHWKQQRPAVRAKETLRHCSRACEYGPHSGLLAKSGVSPSWSPSPVACSSPMMARLLGVLPHRPVCSAGASCLCVQDFHLLGIGHDDRGCDTLDG